MKLVLILTTLLLTLVGCKPDHLEPSPSPTKPPSMRTPKMMVHRGQVAPKSDIAAASEFSMGLRVDIYHLQLPIGTISRNEAFWKRIDEQRIDIATYDLLLKNGVRVGQASIGEWDYFRELIQQHPAITKIGSMVATENKPVELPLRKEVKSEEIFYFDASNKLQGRSFDGSENIISMTFQHAPRKEQTMRIVMCPMIRSQRKRLEFSPLNKEMEVPYVATDRLYDLNLRTDVPIDNFLIIAPSGEATWPTSIGNNFFITNGPAEQMENVLLIVPNPSRTEEVTANPPTR